MFALRVTCAMLSALERDLACVRMLIDVNSTGVLSA
jgi:hypothetical protein